MKSKSWLSANPPVHYRKLYQQIPRAAKVLDVGCLGFRQVEIAQECGRADLAHYGVDYCAPKTDLPPGFTFKQANVNDNAMPFPDDTFDLVVASHIIEHVDKPVDFVAECIRLAKPGGLVYIEAPSERTLWLPGMPFGHDQFHSLSFYDDPTHCQRPWTRQALHRLACYLECKPLETNHIYSWRHRLLFPFTLLLSLLAKRPGWLETVVWQSVGWSVYLIARKPESVSGKPSFSYYLPDSR